MRSYYEYGIKSPSENKEEAYQVLFERITKTKLWEQAKNEIEDAVKNGHVNCILTFVNLYSEDSDPIVDLKLALQYLGYDVWIKDYDYNGNRRLSFKIDWDK